MILFTIYTAYLGYCVREWTKCEQECYSGGSLACRGWMRMVRNVGENGRNRDEENWTDLR